MDTIVAPGYAYGCNVNMSNFSLDLDLEMLNLRHSSLIAQALLVMNRNRGQLLSKVPLFASAQLDLQAVRCSWPVRHMESLVLVMPLLQ